MRSRLKANANLDGPGDILALELATEIMEEAATKTAKDYSSGELSPGGPSSYGSLAEVVISDSRNRGVVWGMPGSAADLRQGQVTNELKHLARLFGLGIYFLVASLGCAKFAFDMAARYDLDHVNVSVAYLAAVAVGLVVYYSLYAFHTKHIQESREYLQKSAGKRIVGELAYARGLAIGMVVMATAVFVIPRPVSPGKSVESPKPIEQARTGNPPVLSPMPPEQQGDLLDRLRRDQLKSFFVLLPHEKSGLVVPKARDACELGEVFTAEEFDECQKQIRKHPPQTGIGPIKN